MTTEEPRIQRALQMVMEILDKEIPRALVRTSFRALDADIVAQAEETLRHPSTTFLEERNAKTRELVESALREWLEAFEDYLHFVGR